MRKALMIGSAVADILIHVDHLPSLEEDVEPTGQSMSIGGCCFNVTNTLSRFDVPYTLFSPVGSGLYGTFVKEQLAIHHMKTPLVTDKENGCCYCLIDHEGHRTFLALHGAEYLFEKEWFDSLNMQEYTDAYICGLEIEDKTGDVIVDFIKRNPQLNVFFAPSSRILHIPQHLMNDLLDCKPILHLNRREAIMYLNSIGWNETDDPDPSQLARILYTRTNNTVFVTNGKHGAWAFDGEHDYHEKAFKTTVVDGTGAGDSHIGTLMALLMKGYSVKTALRAAAFVSAQVVSQVGGILPEFHEGEQNF